MCAEVLARRSGLGGVFFGLPTMATSNPMFSRVREWLNAVPAKNRSSITLAHSKAALNEEYQQLMPWNAAMPVYDDAATTQHEASAVVHEWFLGRKRAILANHVVGTIDQALFTGLKAKHVVLRHLGLASKVVIIDEVHAADVYMREYLKVVLEWLGAYRTPVILMSATLPPAQRHQLALAYAKGRHGRGAQGGAGPAGRSAASTGGAGAPPVLAEGAPLGMSIMLLAHICPAGQAIRRCHHHTTPATQATHPVAIAVTTHG